MILMKSGNRFICIATILDIRDAAGRAAAWKTIVTVEVAVKKGGIVKKGDLNVAFWNARDLSRPQMAYRAKKLHRGDRVLALIAADEKEYSCLAFVRKEGLLSLEMPGGQTYYCGMGYVYHTRKTEKAYAIAVPFHYKDHVKWNQVGYLTSEGRAEKASQKSVGRVCFVADAKQDFVKRDGSDATKYHGIELISLPENGVEDITINIGVYRNDPKPLSELVQMAKYEPKVAEWLRFVAEKWQPTDQAAAKQKQAIARYLQTA